MRSIARLKKNSSPLATPFITVLALGVRTTWETKKVPFLLQEVTNLAADRRSVTDAWRNCTSFSGSVVLAQGEGIICPGHRKGTSRAMGWW
ncbi:hypothetical protein EYF80_025239 [Liparis tanakae]|uniref:Uncharacterized protein n=1 Tax=Liparis tanakae TaxID=230148 RepID=A0A4Z2HFW5_9TELE|nr:hypothetical protein EYF80_025239 [Liparis tanakae]